MRSNGTVNWIDQHASQQESAELYITAVYFSMLTATTVGYGSYANNPEEFAFLFVMMLVGCAGYSYIIGSLSSIFSASDTKSA